MFLEGCYVCENMWWRVAWSHVWWNFLGSVVGVSARMIDFCWFNGRECHVGWWLCVSSVERVTIRSLAICLVPGHWMMMIAFITIKSSLVPLIEGLCAQI